MPARRGGKIDRVGCEGYTHAILRDRRYLRWRCTHHHCKEAMEAKANGLHCYHVRDMETGEMLESEFEEPRLRLAS